MKKKTTAIKALDMISQMTENILPGNSNPDAIARAMNGHSGLAPKKKFQFGDMIPGATDGATVIRTDRLIEQYIHTEEGDNHLRKLKWAESSIQELQVMVMTSGGGWYGSTVSGVNKSLKTSGIIRMTDCMITGTLAQVTYTCGIFYKNPRKLIEGHLDWLANNSRIEAYEFTGMGTDPYFKNINQRQYIYQIKSALDARLFNLNMGVHKPSGFDIFIKRHK